MCDYRSEKDVKMQELATLVEKQKARIAELEAKLQAVVESPPRTSPGTSSQPVLSGATPAVAANQDVQDLSQPLLPAADGAPPMPPTPQIPTDPLLDIQMSYTWYPLRTIRTCRFYTQASLKAMEQWISDPGRYWTPNMAVFGAFAHLWTRESFWCFYVLVIASVICVVYSPTHHRIFTLVSGILALIVVIPCSLRSLRHYILPWKAWKASVEDMKKSDEKRIVFGVPFVTFDIGAIWWLCVGTMISSFSVWSKMTGWVAIAHGTSSPDDLLSCSATILLVFGIIMPVKEFLFSQPACNKRHNHDDANYPTVPSCGDGCIANVVRFEESNANDVERKPEHFFFCVLAEHLGVVNWCSNHYECYVKYGRAMGNWFASQQSVEIPLLSIEAIRRHEKTLTQTLNLRILRSVTFLLRQRVQSTIPTILFSTVPKLMAQVTTFHALVKPGPVWSQAWNELPLVSGVFSGFVSFAITVFGGYSTLWTIFKEFRKVQREWESCPNPMVVDPVGNQQLQKDIKEELKSARNFFLAALVLELLCIYFGVVLVLQVHFQSSDSVGFWLAECACSVL